MGGRVRFPQIFLDKPRGLFCGGSNSLNCCRDGLSPLNETGSKVSLFVKSPCVGARVPAGGHDTQ